MPNQPTAKLEQYFTRQQVAAMFAISLQSVDQRIRTGEWPAIRIGRSVRIRLSDLEAAIAAPKAKVQ